jgi:hypothetical protein
VFVTFNQAWPYVTVSSDQGFSWSAPKQLDQISQTYFFSCGSVVRNSDGAAFIAYTAIPNSAFPNPPPTTYGRVYASNSLFSSWSIYEVDSWEGFQNCSPLEKCDSDYLIGACGMSLGSDETVYYVANAQYQHQGGLRTILYSLGTKDVNFSQGIDVSDAPIDPSIYHGFPMVANGPSSGDVRVAWMDNRTGDWNLYYRESTDYGQSWSSSIRLSQAQLFKLLSNCQWVSISLW